MANSVKQFTKKNKIFSSISGVPVALFETATLSNFSSALHTVSATLHLFPATVGQFPATPRDFCATLFVLATLQVVPATLH